MTEREMLNNLVALVKQKKLRIQSPDYQASHCYSPQWKIMGNFYYYELPHHGGIVAVRTRSGHYFDADGLDLAKFPG